MTAFDDKITAGFGYWRNGAQGSSCTAAILSRECLLWAKSGHRLRLFDHTPQLSRRAIKNHSPK